MFLYIAFLCATWVVWKLVRGFHAPRSTIDNLPGPPSPSWLSGHLGELYDRQGWRFHRELMNYGPACKLRQMFGRPLLCVYDSAALHSIAIKDQYIFEEMQWFQNLTVDTFGPGVFSTVGEVHRKQRKLLNPVFSNKNLQQMTPVFYEVTNRLTSGIRTLACDGTAEVDMGGYMSRAALEIIGQAAIGRSFDPLTEIRPNPYADALRAYLPSIYALSNYFYLYRVLRPLIPAPLRRPLMDLIPSRRVKFMTQTIDAMHAHAVAAYYEKRRAADENGIHDDPAGTSTRQARDLMMILLSANAGASKEDALPEEELIAQLSTILFAATDTTANALSLVLDRLTRRPEAQDKLREEVLEAKGKHGGGELPYDELLALPYLDAICKETLRVHAPLPLRFRETRADAVLPLSKPIRGKDGTPISSIFVPKDTLVFIPIQAANVNPDLWGADASEWRPERWLEPLPVALTEAKLPGVYSNLMTFWGGGRACIGFKFSELSMKIVLSELLAAFHFEATDKPVVWNIGEVVYPTVGHDSTRSGFPLNVTAL
ncbi:cytochrome P450 [Trametes polyzona]|nr:cytochrome P450 [Trametes polyzona]